jgi:hypothetical protein
VKATNTALESQVGSLQLELSSQTSKLNQKSTELEASGRKIDQLCAELERVKLAHDVLGSEYRAKGTLSATGPSESTLQLAR